MNFISEILLPSVQAASAKADVGQKMSFWQMIQAPEDISVNGHLIDYLFNYTTIMNLFFFFLVCGGIFGFSYFYSKKRNPKPYYTHGTKKIHIIVSMTIAALVFVTIDMNITRISNNDFTKVFANWPKGEDIVRIEVMAQQWMWNVRYPGKDKVFNTSDDVVLNNDFRVPVGKKVVFQLVSKDVIHSLYFPNTRRKVDAIPGKVTRMWFEVTKPGVYDVACAEMCGTHHYKMKAQLTVYSQEDYEKWLNEAENMAAVEHDPENQMAFWGWKWEN